MPAPPNARGRPNTAPRKDQWQTTNAVNDAPDRPERQGAKGQIVAGNIGGKMFLHWCCSRELLRSYLAGAPAPDDCLGITADWLRLEISFHENDAAAEQAARDMRDKAALALRPVGGEA